MTSCSSRGQGHRGDCLTTVVSPSWAVVGRPWLDLFVAVGCADVWRLGAGLDLVTNWFRGTPTFGGPGGSGLCTCVSL